MTKIYFKEKASQLGKQLLIIIGITVTYSIVGLPLMLKFFEWFFMHFFGYTLR